MAGLLVASKGNMQTTQQPANAGDPLTSPARLRLRLATADDVRRELARIYREGKAGQRDIADVSRLANVLQILNRCIETSDLERRVADLESTNP
jgi:hypothetical protein